MALLASAFLMIRFACVFTEGTDLTQSRIERAETSLLQRRSCGSSLLFGCDHCEAIRNLSAALTNDGTDSEFRKSSGTERAPQERSLVSKCEGLQVCELQRAEFPDCDKCCLSVNYTCERRKIWSRVFPGDSAGNANVSLSCDKGTQRLHIEEVVLRFSVGASKRCFKKSANSDYVIKRCRSNSCNMTSGLGESSCGGGENRFNDAVLIYFTCTGNGAADSNFCGNTTNGSSTVSSNTGQSVNADSSDQKCKQKTSITAVKRRATTTEVKETRITGSAMLDSTTSRASWASRGFALIIWSVIPFGSHFDNPLLLTN